MDSSTTARLIEINQQFYQTFGPNFSETRQRLQPGIHTLLEQISPNHRILELGCGNGELVRELARQGHRAPYYGIDFSEPLISEARESTRPFPAYFFQADLSATDWDQDFSARITQPFDVVFALAVLHHIPGQELRRSLARKVHGLLRPGGQFMLSNWQFLNSDRLQARIQPWESVGLKSNQVDKGDYLLDWRHGGTGLRYVHHFSSEELAELAQASGFQVVQEYHSDGEGGRLGLYQIWARD